MMQEKTEQNWTQTDSAPGASQDQAAFGGDKGTDAAHEAAGPRGYGAHGGPHPQGRGNGGAHNAGPGMEPLDMGRLGKTRRPIPGAESRAECKTQGRAWSHPLDGRCTAGPSCKGSWTA